MLHSSTLKRISRTRGSYIAGKTLIICLKRRGGLFICASWELKWGKTQRYLPQKTSSMNGDKVCWLLVCYFSFDRKLNSCRKYCFAATTVENSDRLLLWKKWGDIFWYKNQDLLSMVDVCDGRTDGWAAAVMKTEAKDNGKTIGFRLYVCAQWCWFWDRGEKYVFEKYSMWDSMYSCTLYSKLYLKNKNCNSCNVDTLTIFVIPVAFIIIAMVIIFLKCLFVLRTNPFIAFHIHFIYTNTYFMSALEALLVLQKIKWFDIKGQYYLCFTIFGSTDAFVGVCSSESDNWLLYLQIQSHWSNNFLSGENSFTSKDSLINHLKEEAEPLVEGDGAVPVLVHLGEGLLPLLRQLEGGGQPEPLLGGRGDRDHCWELEAGNLTISVCVGSLRVWSKKDFKFFFFKYLEAFPGEPINLLVALWSRVQGLKNIDKIQFDNVAHVCS